MTDPDDQTHPINPRAAAYGEALRRLRQQGGVSQVEAARAACLSQAAWTKYERGRTLAFLNLLNQEKCVTALGRTLDDLEAMRETVESGGAPIGPAAGEIDDHGFHEDGARFDPWPMAGDDTRPLTVTDDSLSPYAEPGETVVYSLTALPRADRGVVLKRRNGSLLLRRYHYSTPDYVVCSRLETASLGGLMGWIEHEEQYAIAEIEGLYPVLWRGGGKGY
jgi:transcriptional regulator with XRE-family HTH domain